MQARQAVQRCGFRKPFLRLCRLCPPHPRCRRRSRNVRWSKGRSLLGHFWLIHFRKMSNPPPRLLSLIEVFERRTVPPAMEQPTKRKAITLSKIRFILPLFTISLLSFFKTYIFIISKTLQFTKRFRKIFKKFNGRDWSLRAGACNRAVGASTHKLFKFACADISHRKHTFNGCFHIFIC